ncbi:hypothetical protein BGX27_003125 [Mortierella sp. AM989]|nr:hypothetical protein BGX27_003125 [Mortierella sp. AM989]
MPRIPSNVAATLPRKLGPAPKPLPSNFKPTEAKARSLFRQLWRMGSLSIMYTNPGRDMIRRKIREAFNESQDNPKTDPDEIRQQWERALNTKFFFEVASTRYGIEHTVISNLTRISAEEMNGTARPKNQSMRVSQKRISEEYNSTIQALNESMGLSLR